MDQFVDNPFLIYILKSKVNSKNKDQILINDTDLNQDTINLKDRNDFISQLISCREWFPPKNYHFIVLKKDYQKSIQKIEKRL